MNIYSNLRDNEMLSQISKFNLCYFNLVKLNLIHISSLIPLLLCFAKPEFSFVLLKFKLVRLNLFTDFILHIFAFKLLHSLKQYG